MKQFMLHVKSQPTTKVGSDAKNALPTSTCNYADVLGLSWIFRENYA
ncbi:MULTISPECIES: hypothetical protein [Nitrosopumilus]|nr:MULTISPECIES: hypothetical protein [Nitrosopumilus]